MIELNVAGKVKSWLGNNNGQYLIRTGYNQRKNIWFLHVENNKQVWREDYFLSEFEADSAGNRIAVEISRGNFII